MQCSEHLIPAQHFTGRDFLRLYFDSKVRGSEPEAEESQREQASRASPVSSTPISGDSSSASRGPGRDKRGIRLARLPLPRKGTGSAP